MSKSLEQLLRERVEFDGWNPGELMGVGDIMNTGGKAENNRLKPLLDSLIKVAVAAERIVRTIDCVGAGYVEEQGQCDGLSDDWQASSKALNDLRESLK